MHEKGHKVTTRRLGAQIIALAALVIVLDGLPTGYKTELSAAELPVRIIKVTFESGAHESFVNQIQKFAEDQGFEIRVSQRSPDPKDTLIQMRRRDVKMIVIRVRATQTQELRYDVGYYYNGDRPLPIDTVDQLVEDLRATVETVPITTFTITK